MIFRTSAWLHRGTLVLALSCAAVTLTTLTAAEAKGRKPSISGYTSLDYACSSIKYEVEKLVGEYKNTSESRRSQILQKLSGLGKKWDQIGCRSAFGDVGTKVGTLPPPSVQLPGSAIPGNTGAIDPGPSQKPQFHSPYGRPVTPQYKAGPKG